ncbi:hypothetical protein C7M61_004404 [Candidozyma pseudohaemuli]|uniref:DNA-directed RNA polymerase III subunit RPC4 n=1 Tax=Candidozyma pseudohaemuli TaxID=418784 RepID=A0A2P7YI41_9ASCO|nr:hypothetical protein C7M61_004404 [[Candida] pseudohaemulonii]PSK35615.1 hypothetical protein C7M61_004404 [[Candida] pseudohaemulonii]
MSNRLDSLNPKKSGSKPALKFKPKVVARKSKEDRDKNAPIVKTEEKPNPPPTRGRGGARGRGRGRGGAYVGTHLVSSGPLASSAVGSGPVATSKTGLTSDKVYGSGGKEQADPLQNLKLKSRTQTDSVQGEESDDEGGLTKINMSKEYQFDESETVLFPVRPYKDEEKAAVKAAIPLSSTVSASSSRAPSRTPRPELVKSESSEDIKIEATPGPVAERVGDTVENDEHDRLIDDQRAIVDLVTGKFAGLKAEDSGTRAPGNYFMVHLPQISKDSETDEKMETDSTTSSLALPTLADFQGQIGQLNFHRSGKITMSIGANTTLNVAQGVPSNFLQELYVIEAADKPKDDDEEVLDERGQKIAGNVHRLGEVTAKLVATPEIR